jgi:hypothetical protein
MKPQFEHIPYAELNRFYSEVVASMHLALRPLATDMRVLRHEEMERHTDQIAEEIYQPQYSYVPWMVADYFGMAHDDAALVKLGKAWWLTIIDVVITDQIVDRQVPDLVGIPLMLQHLRLHSERLYRDVFDSSAPFWARYQAALAGVWDALAHETYCVDAHQQVYTDEQMQHVCKLRSDLIGTIVAALGDISGQAAPVEPLSRFYENLTFADQLLDDSSDWKGDLAVGRHTLPIVMAADAGNIPLAEIALVPRAEIELLMDRHGVLVELAARATALLEDGDTALASLSPSATPLRGILRERIKTGQHAIKRYTAMRHMTAFIHRLEHGKA